MKPRTDPRLVALFGSEARVRVLAVLASAYAPMNGAQISRTAGVPPPKAHEQLHSLSVAGIVEHREDGWRLLDRDVRVFLRKRLQLRSSEDWLREHEERRPERLARFARLQRLRSRVLPPKGWKPRDSSLDDDAEKSRLVSEMRLGVDSGHEA